MTELSKLTELLHEKTTEGKIKWISDYDNRIHTMLGANIVEILSLDEMDPAMQMLTLRDINGVIRLRETFNQGTAPFELLKRIFANARQVSPGVSEVLSDLRSRLEAL